MHELQLLLELVPFDLVNHVIVVALLDNIILQFSHLLESVVLSFQFLLV